ncbi:hypothetical protein VPH35_042844 [Triticum aestivum]
MSKAPKMTGSTQKVYHAGAMSGCTRAVNEYTCVPFTLSFKKTLFDVRWPLCSCHVDRGLMVLFHEEKQMDQYVVAGALESTTVQLCDIIMPGNWPMAVSFKIFWRLCHPMVVQLLF